MTYTEKKQPKFAVGDEVFILDNRIWVKGDVLEVGYETILIQWSDLKEPTEYDLSDLPDIRNSTPGNTMLEICKVVNDGMNVDNLEKVTPPFE